MHWLSYTAEFAFTYFGNSQINLAILCVCVYKGNCIKKGIKNNRESWNYLFFLSYQGGNQEQENSK